MNEKMLVHLSKFINKIFIIVFLSIMSSQVFSEEKNIDLIETDWNFEGIFGRKT